ncbi:hypothetical protein [Micromonospora sp. NBC_01813]|uniref:hypothetical protein n=1 Tax=Micromonospora sp. NBC_01813 TaxID=2975988 RepID=UPI002DD91141|nr:hypothetical protein [Micromonospora sp. NBC_01813]WSA11749.1 hypothetical protein OG958_13720 [Micromonospora sp. NBC_01813]
MADTQPLHWLLRPGNDRRLLPAVAAAILAVVIVAAPDVPCSEASPCGPDAPGNLVLGMFAVLPVLHGIQLGFASALAFVAPLALFAYDLSRPDEHFALWGYLLLVGLAAGYGWLTRAARRPSQAGWRRPAASAVFVVIMLIGGALACVAFSVERQERADAQQRAAQILSATVRSHFSSSEIELDLPGDRPAVLVEVYDAGDFPVGSTTRIAVDDRGLRQLVAEPYDASPWYALAAMLAIVGVGLGWRAVRTEPPAGRHSSPGRRRPDRHGTDQDGIWAILSSRSARRTWADLGRWEPAVFAVIIAGALIVGISRREALLVGLLDVGCSDTGCRPAVLAVLGWAIIGAPMLVIVTAYLLGDISRVTIWVCFTAVAVLTCGLTVMLAETDGSADQAAFDPANPELALLHPGFGAALFALVLGSSLARFGTDGDGRLARLLRVDSGRVGQAGFTFLTIGGCQVVALLAALGWVALAG